MYISKLFYYTIFNQSINCTYVTGDICDNPYLYSDLYIRLIIFIPFMYFVAECFRSQKLTLNSDSLCGVSICISLAAFKLSTSFQDYVFQYGYHADDGYDIYWKINKLLQIASYITVYDYYSRCFKIFYLIGVPYSKFFEYLYILIKYFFLLLVPAIYFPNSNKIFEVIYQHYYVIVNYTFCSFAFSTYSVCYYLLEPKVQAVIPKSIITPLKITSFIMCFGYIVDIVSWHVVSSKWYISKIEYSGFYAIITEVILLLPIFLENIPLLVIITLLNRKSAFDDNKSEASNQRSCEISLI